MSLPIVMAGISGGLNILGGLESNKAITKAATAQYNANLLNIDRDYFVQEENLAYSATEVNNELGMQLTALNDQFRKAFATTTATNIERNITGNTAERIQAVSEMRKELSADSMTQAAEANMVDVQTKMRANKYERENRHSQNAQAYNNSMSQRKSTLGILSDGLSGAASGFQLGTGLETSWAKYTALKG